MLWLWSDYVWSGGHYASGWIGSGSRSTELASDPAVALLVCHQTHTAIHLLHVLAFVATLLATAQVSQVPPGHLVLEAALGLLVLYLVFFSKSYKVDKRGTRLTKEVHPTPFFFQLSLLPHLLPPLLHQSSLFITVYLPLPSCLSARPPAFLSACLLAHRPADRPSCLPACLPACLLYCPPACLLICKSVGQLV